MKIERIGNAQAMRAESIDTPGTVVEVISGNLAGGVFMRISEYADKYGQKWPWVRLDQKYSHFNLTDDKVKVLNAKLVIE